MKLHDAVSSIHESLEISFRENKFFAILYTHHRHRVAFAEKGTTVEEAIEKLKIKLEYVTNVEQLRQVEYEA